MTSPTDFRAIRVTRRTQETEFEILLGPRTGRMASLPLPNKLLSHFIDHLAKAAGFDLTLVRTDYPGSWAFDHVLCEDLGQLVGRGVAELHATRAAECGVAGRAMAAGCMDDARADLVVSFEGRPRVQWNTGDTDIDGFVDAWYDDGGRTAGAAHGTNLRQFLDGFALGSGATVYVAVQRAGNLHHLYEVLFRALGDAVREALGLGTVRLPGETSGLAGAVEYLARVEQEVRDG